MAKGKVIALWVLSILLAAEFLLAGSLKLLNPSQVRPMFVHYGYPGWFAIFIGVCEALGAIGLLVPRVAGLAAAGLSVIMVGATYTHLSHHENRHALTPLVLLALLIVVAYVRFKSPRQATQAAKAAATGSV